MKKSSACNWTLALLALLVSWITLGCARAAEDWSPTGEMSNGRSFHTETLLTNGKVLVAGGYGNSNPLSSAELYDPVKGSWTNTDAMSGKRYFHSATLLMNGKVLVAGGEFGGSSAELYDPATASWTSTGGMSSGRAHHTATLLTNGKVLVAGGNMWPTGTRLFSAELYDPATGSWTSTGGMSAVRAEHTATLLTNGKVLVAGGIIAGGSTSSVIYLNAELYDPATEIWTDGGEMSIGRVDHTATLLADGKVLVAGGRDNRGSDFYFSSAELYDLSTGAWTSTGAMSDVRHLHTATLLANGKVLVAGGLFNNYLSSAELYDQATGNWTSTGAMSSIRSYHTATLLTNDKVLVAGGVQWKRPPFLCGTL